MEYYEALSAKSLDVVRNLLHSEFVDRTAIGLATDQAGFFRAWPQPPKHSPTSNWTVQDLFVASDQNKIAVRALLSGTRSGLVFGVEPTYPALSATSIETLRSEDDRIIERWGVVDANATREQLGVFPRFLFCDV